MEECVFCKIIRKEIPVTFLYEDDKVVVFKDTNPQKPVHLLTIPKEHIEDFYDLDGETAAAIVYAVQKMIDENNLMGQGYKVEVNGGGAQLVNHLHFHLIAPVPKPK